MVNDTDGASTSWYTYNDVINVVNNKPLLLNYSFSRDSVERTNTTVISINSSDNEDADVCIHDSIKPSEGSWSTVVV